MKIKLTIVLVFITVQVWGADIIRLLPECNINNEWVKLSDIASLEFADSILKDRLKNLSVARVPLPGQTRQISSELVKLRLAQNNINPDNFAIINDVCLVSRNFQTLDTSMIKKEIINFLEPKLPKDFKNIKYKLTYLPLKKSLPEGKITYRVVTPNFLPTRWSSPFTLNVEVLVDGKLQGRVPVRVIINAYKCILVATENIQRGSILSKNNVKEKLIHIRKIPRGAVEDINKLNGMRASRVIPQGTVIVPERIERIPIIKKGDLVKIIARVSGIEVGTKGIALSEGYYGDRVLVRNIDTKKIVQGKVLEHGIVQVTGYF